MEKECRKYARNVAEEIEAIYNGTTEEENDVKDEFWPGETD